MATPAQMCTTPPPARLRVRPDGHILTSRYLALTNADIGHHDAGWRLGWQAVFEW